jgi:hypothetical protein
MVSACSTQVPFSQTSATVSSASITSSRSLRGRVMSRQSRQPVSLIQRSPYSLRPK